LAHHGSYDPYPRIIHDPTGLNLQMMRTLHPVTATRGLRLTLVSFSQAGCREF
jgi:hypothetical protein